MAKAKAPARTELSRADQEEIIKGGGSVMLADGEIYSKIEDLPDTDESIAAAESELAARKSKAAGSDSAKTIDEMTVPELKEYAEKNEIDLTGLSLKPEILAAIKKASK